MQRLFSKMPSPIRAVRKLKDRTLFSKKTQRRNFCDAGRATEVVGENASSAGGFPKFLVSPVWGVLSIAAIYGNYKMDGMIWNELDDRNRAYRLSLQPGDKIQIWKTYTIDFPGSKKTNNFSNSVSRSQRFFDAEVKQISPEIQIYCEEFPDESDFNVCTDNEKLLDKYKELFEPLNLNGGKSAFPEHWVAIVFACVQNIKLITGYCKYMTGVPLTFLISFISCAPGWYRSKIRVVVEEDEKTRELIWPSPNINQDIISIVQTTEDLMNEPWALKFIKDAEIEPEETEEEKEEILDAEFNEDTKNQMGDQEDTALETKEATKEYEEKWDSDFNKETKQINGDQENADAYDDWFEQKTAENLDAELKIEEQSSWGNVYGLETGVIVLFAVGSLFLPQLIG